MNIENIFEQNDISLLKTQTPVLDSYVDELTKIGEGINSIVYKVKDTDWVLKEGKWKLHLQLVNKKILIDTKNIESLSKYFGLTFRPTKEETQRQYNNFLTLCKYFGNFENQQDNFQKMHKDLLLIQLKNRKNIIQNIPKLIKYYKVPNVSIEKIINILNKNLNYNFILPEYTIYTKGIYDQKNTYLILQKYFEGNDLNSLNTKQFENKQKDLFILFLFLILQMHYETKLILDLRAKNFHKTLDWVGNTDNIRINSTDLKIIDTRWVWESKSNIVKRGLLNPEIIIANTIYYIQHYS